MSADRRALASFESSHPWRDEASITDDEIRALRREAAADSKAWRSCTLALHAADPADRSYHRTTCAGLWNARRETAIATWRTGGGRA